MATYCGREPLGAEEVGRSFYWCNPAFRISRRHAFLLRSIRAGTRGPPPSVGYPLVIVVHGTARTVEEYRCAFQEFAEQQQCIILLPVFPVGVTRALDLDEYKRLESGGIRYDELLLGMVDEVALLFPIQTESCSYMDSPGADNSFIASCTCIQSV